MEGKQPAVPASAGARSAPASGRFAAAAAAFAAAAVLFLLFSVVRECLVPAGADFERAQWRLTGDEPSYLLTAQAIASGDGEDVSRVHAAGSYRNFQTRPVIGEGRWTWADYRRQGCSYLIDRSAAWGPGKQVLQRPPLIALFAAPFALRPSGVRWSVAAALGSVTALAAFFMVLWAVRSGAPAAWSAWTAVCFLGGLPVVYYTCEIFPEVLNGVLAALALLLCRSGRRPARTLSIALLIVSLWGTGRVVPAVAAVTLLLAFREWRGRNWAAVAVFAAGWAVYLGYNLRLWGYVLPPAPPDGGTLDLGRIPRGLLLNFAGNDFGLFFLSPVSVAGAVAAVWLVAFRRDDPVSVPAALFAALTALVVASFSNPRAGTCPAGRYQVVQAFALLVPALVLPALVSRRSAAARRFRTLLAVAGVPTLAMGVFVGVHPTWWFARYHPLFTHPVVQPRYWALPDFSGRWLPPLAAWTAAALFVTFLPDLLSAVRRLLFPSKTTTASEIHP